MIQTVSNVIPNSSKSRFLNYSKNENVISKANSINQLSDSFTHSTPKSQVSFKGGPAGLIREVKLGGVMTRLGEEAKGSIGGLTRRLKGNDEIPISKKPEILLSSSSDRAKIIQWNKDHPYDVQIKVPPADSTNVSSMTGPNSDYNSAVKNSKKYYDDSTDGTSFTGGTDVDDGGVVSEAASSAVGDGAKEVAGGIVSTVVEETVGEGVCQAFERGLDCILPGAGVLLTGFRWARRAYKVGKFLGS